MNIRDYIHVQELISIYRHNSQKDWENIAFNHTRKINRDTGKNMLYKNILKRWQEKSKNLRRQIDFINKNRLFQSGKNWGQLNTLIKDDIYKIIGQPALVFYLKNKSIQIQQISRIHDISEVPYFDQRIGFHYMREPINNIADSTYWTLALELSVYGYIFENQGRTVEKLYIWHQTPYNADERIEVPYLKEEVIKLLEDYKENAEKKQ
ncbi:MAG: hypothetical protein SGJ10_06850 [Bacteroidota bacterium]|nr:hypothetical protein [Bacteroidota bacterium]